MTVAVEDTNSKLVDVVTFPDVDIEESVDDRSVIDDTLATAFLLFNYCLTTVHIIFVKHVCILFRKLPCQEHSTTGLLCLWQQFQSLCIFSKIEI